MNLNQCPRFDGCGAPVCPLDAGWRERTYLRGEAVCSLVLEAVKPDGAAAVRRVLRSDAATTAVLVAAVELPQLHAAIVHRVARASRQKARTAAFIGKPKPTRRPALNAA